LKPDLELRTDLLSANECVAQVLEYLHIHATDTAISI
jgi:hypothetical protein